MTVENGLIQTHGGMGLLYWATGLQTRGNPEQPTCPRVVRETEHLGRTPNRPLNCYFDRIGMHVPSLWNLPARFAQC